MTKPRRRTDGQQRVGEHNIGLVPAMVRRVAERWDYWDWDALQSEAQLAICMAATTWRPPPEGSKFSTYACNAMVYTMRRHISRERKRPETASTDALAVADARSPRQRDHHVQAAAVLDELCMLLAAVDPTTRRVMIQYYGHDCSHREVERVVGCSYRTSQRRSLRGMTLARATAERLCA